MSHPEQQDFVKRMSVRFKEHFEGSRVLEVGSLNVNGSVREHFKDCEYLGIDVNPGRDVDLVIPVHEMEHENGYFDVVISAECFEHDPYFIRSIRRILELIKPNGLFICTCATKGRPEHGTPRTDGDDFGPESGYYRNLVREDFVEVRGWNECFGKGQMFMTSGSDLHIFGMKQGQGVLKYSW